MPVRPADTSRADTSRADTRLWAWGRPAHLEGGARNCQARSDRAVARPSRLTHAVPTSPMPPPLAQPRPPMPQVSSPSTYARRGPPPTWSGSCSCAGKPAGRARCFAAGKRENVSTCREGRVGAILVGVSVLPNRPVPDSLSVCPTGTRRCRFIAPAILTASAPAAGTTAAPPTCTT